MDPRERVERMGGRWKSKSCGAKGKLMMRVLKKVKKREKGYGERERERERYVERMVHIGVEWNGLEFMMREVFKR